MKEDLFHFTDKAPLRCFKNVKKYHCKESPEFAYCIHYESEELPKDSNVPIYFILDSENSSAFSHWVYENATWLPFFLEVQKKYPTCFLVLESIKQYKYLFLSYYGISNECVRLHSDIPPDNYCFFHTYTSLNDKHIPSLYYSNLLTYEKKIQGNSSPKEIPILYLPRGTKENFVGVNNRVYNIQDELKEIVKFTGGTVYETDTTSSLEQQITLIRKAKTIILDYGSNLWVNGLFAHDTRIICLNIGWNQHSQYPGLRFLWNRILQTNSIEEIFAYPASSTNTEGISVVHFYLKDVLECLFKK